MARNMQEARPGKPALLIVDDDALIADTLAYALGTDFEVYACESRTHAICSRPPTRTYRLIWPSRFKYSLKLWTFWLQLAPVTSGKR